MNAGENPPQPSKGQSCKRRCEERKGGNDIPPFFDLRQWDRWRRTSTVTQITICRYSWQCCFCRTRYINVIGCVDRILLFIILRTWIGRCCRIVLPYIRSTLSRQEISLIEINCISCLSIRCVTQRDVIYFRISAITYGTVKIDSNHRITTYSLKRRFTLFGYGNIRVDNSRTEFRS